MYKQARYLCITRPNDPAWIWFPEVHSIIQSKTKFYAQYAIKNMTQNSLEPVETTPSLLTHWVIGACEENIFEMMLI